MIKSKATIRGVFIYMYLASSPTISIYWIKTDTIWIYGPYRIWESGVKSKSIKKGKSGLPDLPFSFWILFVNLTGLRRLIGFIHCR